jgi:hypothetical protein
MLSERVLDEMSRRSVLTEELVKAAWPDLSLEAKLQVIDAHHAQFSPSTPNWLTDLALDDKSPVVQYMALRFAYLRRPVPEGVEIPFPPSVEDIALYRRAHAIEHPLPRAALEDIPVFGGDEMLLKCTQLERLALMRNKNLLALSSLADFLAKALDKLDDRELAAVAHEYFLRPDTQAELKRGRWGFHEGESAYYAGEGLQKAWEVLRKAGPALTNVMVTHLPTTLGMTTIEAKDLATMPPRVLELLAHNVSGSKEIAELHAMMTEQPSRFHKKAVEALETAREYGGRYDADEIQRERRLASALTDRVTLEAVLELQQQVTKLAEQMQEMRANPPKRGFFG